MSARQDKRRQGLIRQGLGWLAVLAWPFLVWLALVHPQARGWLPCLALAFVLRLLSLKGQPGAMGRLAKWLAAAGIVLCAASLILRDLHLLLWYPVVVNVLMLALFAGSLYSDMPVVERLARLREPDLPPKGVIYTRRVTQVWCAFFIFNGGVALLTCLMGNVGWWIGWNGMISYLLMGLLMAGEWMVRRYVKARA